MPGGASPSITEPRPNGSGGAQVANDALAAASSARMRTWSKDGAAIRDWMATARAGDELVYARERHLSRHNEAAAVVRTLIERHMATSCQRLAADAPGTGIKEYVVRRLYPQRASIGHDPAVKRPALDGAMSAVLRVIRECIHDRQACPNNRELARRAKIGTANQASYQLKKLVKRGFVSVAIVNDVTGARVVTILKDGLQTAKPLPNIYGGNFK